MPARDIEQLRRLCKERGFVFPGSAAYGGVASFWDYGPLGVEMLNNIKKAWWQDTVYAREDMEGLDAAVLMSRKVWQHSGHEATFSDPLVDNKKTGKRHRFDDLLSAQSSHLIIAMQHEIKRLLVETRMDGQVANEIGWPNGNDINWLVRVLVEHSFFMVPTIQDFQHPHGEKFSGTHVVPVASGDIRISFSRWNPDQKAHEALGDFSAVDVIRAQPEEWQNRVYRHCASFPEILVGQVSPSPEGLTAAFAAANRAHLDAGGRLLTHFGVLDPETKEPGVWTQPRRFNLMFRTNVGPVEAKLGSPLELEARVYLRPETAQGIFMNFAHVQRSMARKVPFGVAQIGKAFRNEITPGNFIFRTREFEQMEIEFFIKPPQFVKEGEKTDEQWHAEWIEQRFKWWLNYATSPSATGEERNATAERFRARAQAADELAHYAKATTDIEYLFPGALGWGEIEGVANRTDFDLSAHSKDVPIEDLQRLKLEANADSVEKFDYFDPDAKARYIPWVIEPSAGATRAMLTFLCEAYHEEVVKEPTKQQIDQVKSDAAMITKNAEKKIKEAIKAGAEAKHDPAQVQAFIDTFNEVVSRLPASLGELIPALDHPGAANLEPVKKFRPPTEKMVEECMRTVMRLHPALAPIKLAVFPLAKNKPELVDLARSIKAKFQRHFRVVYDQSAGIGKLYRRQDEIGTPYCITVDHQSLEDGSVTVRERDSMAQERVAIDALSAYLMPRLQG